ncbi:MAG: prolyl oligopeptidase family serine peptidase, partial [Gemmataceae bacterium]
MPIRYRFSLVALVALAGLAGSVRGDIIIFKDGFFIHGKVSQDGETVVDNGQAFTVPSGPFFIIDFPRRISFSRLQVVEANPKELNREPMVLTRTSGRLPQPKPIYPLIDLLGTTPFDDKGERLFRMKMPNGKEIDIEQRWTVLTPQFVRVEAKRYVWNSYYRTSELGPELVRSMLVAHPTIQKQPEKDQLFHVARFFGQAGWYDESDKALDELAKKFPDEKEGVALAKKQLVSLKLGALMLEIENARRVGRHKWAQKAIEDFPREQADIDLLTRLRVLQSKYERENEQADKARRYLNELAPKLVDPDHRFLNEAAGVIMHEITNDNVYRLSPFIDLAEQSERDLKNGRKPLNSTPQLLALATNAWLLGNADSNIESAAKSWAGRRFLIDYLAKPQQGDRLIDELSNLKHGTPAIDELAQMLSVLPPFNPEPNKQGVLKLTAPSDRVKGTEYLVHLPLEYTPQRAYPVVVALYHDDGPMAMLERCKEQAAKNGYILAAVNWGGDIFQRRYSYTEQEHDDVLTVIRDLRRRFRVDSDRIFLLGYGEGGNMALDVGLSHPGQFAGVLSMNGTTRQLGERFPCQFVERYTHNGQYLPLYLVNGSHTGDHAKYLQETFTRWSQLGHPALHVEYQGRGLEWFGAELPTMFDWM